MKRVWVSWSSGKDAAWALHLLRQDPSVTVTGLLTTFNAAVNRVAMHAVRRSLVELQAERTGVPLVPAWIPSPCPNDVYEQTMAAAVARARNEGVTHMAFGDLFLEDVRRYRESRLAGTGLSPLFPLWGQPTQELAAAMLDGGLDATLTCVDPRQLDAAFIGRRFDRALIDALTAAGADPCGERGEFHSCVTAGPMFSSPIAAERGEVVHRDGFVFQDLIPVSGLA